MKTIMFSKLLVIFSILAIICFSLTSLFAQQDFDREILVYFTSGVERVAADKSANVKMPGVHAVLNRFNIDQSEVTPAFPNFDERDTLITTPEGQIIGMPNMAKIFKIRVPSSPSRVQVIEALKSLPNVLFAEPNGVAEVDVVPVDPYFSYQWSLQPGGGIGKIQAPEAWDIYKGSSASKIAVIDCGVDRTHPDLIGKVSGHTAVYAYHGTHVAGIASAKTNNINGIAGVNWNAQILAKAFNDGTENGDPFIYQIVTESVNEGANVLNDSWKLLPIGRYSTTVRIAFAYAYKMNRVAVATIGNTGPYQNIVQYPGSFGQGIIAVGATDNNDVVAYFSTRGNAIDVSAPGVNILSTYRNGVTFPDPDYEYADGTSMAAPYVSGIASLLKGYNPNLYNDDIENIIKLSADDKGPTGWDQYYGAGRVNALKALRRLRGPYTLTQPFVVGGTDQGASDLYQMTVYGAQALGLQDGIYWVKRHEVRQTVTYPTTRNVVVWGRGAATNGWANEGVVNFTYGWCEPISGTITSTSAILRTFVYEVFNSDMDFLGWYPTPASNVRFEYTVHGIPAIVASNTNWEGEFDLDGSVTVNSGVTLAISTGTSISFANSATLTVNGTLTAIGSSANRITFNRIGTSGTWGGIRYQSGSSGSLQYANISYATYGVYANNSSPTISNSTISNCSYGVYSYYGSPTMSNNTISSCTYGAYLNHAGNAVVNTNEITACTRGIYGYYAGLSDFTDNYITSGGSTRVAGIQVYATDEPTIYNNTIEGSFTYGLDADHYSRPLAIGPGSQDYQGYNRIIGGQTATVYTHDHSESVLGTCFSSDGYAGYNTIYLDIQTDRFAHIRAENYSNIIAQKNYWGDYPPGDFYADGTSSIDYSYPLSSDPGGGSSLAKMLGGLLADALYINIMPFDDAESVETLWRETTELWQSLQYRKALENCNTLLQNYPDSPYAPLAFLRSIYAKRALKSTDMEDHLQKYVDTQNLRTMALELLIGEDLSNQRFKAAVEKSKTVIKENPDTEAEYKALFGLFNLYSTNLEDKENAQTVLNAMKGKYADYGLTQMAQFEMGETVDWQLARPIAFGKEPEPEVVSILPDKFELKPNYPNPFNPTTNISFALPEASNVQITIFDLTGREIWRSTKTSYAAGNYTITWNGVNQSGANVVSGIYIVRMVTPKYTATQRIILMK